MGRREDEVGDAPPWSGETVMWLACLSVALMPTGLVLMAWRSWIGPVSPVGGLTAYIVVFTAMVVAMRPWTVR
ncbi:hypothetical protein [Caulobacter segnis]